MPDLPTPPDSARPIASRRGQPRSPEDQARDRAALVAAALELLESEGPGALSMRRVAARVGASYQVVYTLFGGKAGLLDALFREGFRRLAEACDARAASGEAMETWLGCAVAYREFALAHRELYALMFGQGVPGFAPDGESRRVAREAFGVVHRSAEAVLAASRPDASPPSPRAIERLARAGWATTHGHVVLELDSWFGPDPDAEARLTDSLETLVTGTIERASRA